MFQNVTCAQLFDSSDFEKQILALVKVAGCEVRLGEGRASGEPISHLCGLGSRGGITFGARRDLVGIVGYKRGKGGATVERTWHPPYTLTTVKRMWHTSDSHGQILALAWRSKPSKL
jgi:hypothetical protein